ncbi:glycosyltransferase [Actinoplanes sp. NPDC049265]|uniref:glycosyltransferase n=1 Tax=Actinoplanes sp. NPDC049265 TaxID=3363902 RepID=UPI00371676B4
MLYLSFYFPPSRASGVFRARATANHLAEKGWDVTVHTAPREFFEHYLDGASDPALETTIDPRVRVVRPAMNMFPFEQDIRRFSTMRRNFPTAMQNLYNLAQRRIFQEPYLGWMPSVLNTAMRQHMRDKFDLVLATGNPFVSFAAAHELGRWFKVPYVVDYRDAWTFNQFTETVRFPEGGHVMRWEEKVLRRASEVVFVNDGMRQWHRDRYPFAADRMTVVPNGWEPELLGRPEFRESDPNKPLTFSYLGTVTSYLPLETLFEGWRLARPHPVMAGSQLNIHGHLGFRPHEIAPIRARIDPYEEYGVNYMGAFSKTEADSVYAGTDVLVFCVPGSRYVTSGKVFEYMATGKPIVSVHEPGLAASEVLSDYPMWTAEDKLTPDAVAQALIASGESARKMDRSTFESALAHAARYTRDATLGPWEQRLRAMVK